MYKSSFLSGGVVSIEHCYLDSQCRYALLGIFFFFSGSIVDVPGPWLLGCNFLMLPTSYIFHFCCFQAIMLFNMTRGITLLSWCRGRASFCQHLILQSAFVALLTLLRYSENSSVASYLRDLSLSLWDMSIFLNIVALTGSLNAMHCSDLFVISWVCLQWGCPISLLPATVFFYQPLQTVMSFDVAISAL